jgi:hypothetical protein
MPNIDWVRNENLAGITYNDITQKYRGITAVLNSKNQLAD